LRILIRSHCSSSFLRIRNAMVTIRWHRILLLIRIRRQHHHHLSVGEEVRSVLLAFAMDSSSDMQSNLPEAKLNLPDTKLNLHAF
jgi:hypothetical protein